MADRLTPEQRHRCMSRIRSRDTRPEMIVRRWLWRQGYRYRVGVRGLPGTPDVVLHRLRTVVFVNGCFWHGHACAGGTRQPQTNADFWRQKILRNQARDERNVRLLNASGWHVLTVWECQLCSRHRLATLHELTLQLSRIALELNAPVTSSALAAEPDTSYGTPARNSD